MGILKNRVISKQDRVIVVNRGSSYFGVEGTVTCVNGRKIGVLIDRYGMIMDFDKRELQKI